MLTERHWYSALIFLRCGGRLLLTVCVAGDRICGCADVVGQKATALARLFGFEVPPSTKVLIGEAAVIGREEPMSFEKLCPVLGELRTAAHTPIVDGCSTLSWWYTCSNCVAQLVAEQQLLACALVLSAGLYKAKDWTDAVGMARTLVEFGGHGHTSCLYTRPTNKEHIKEFRGAMETVRILINSPASQGAIGDLYNFHLDPSLTLGCGSWGSTSVSANVGPQHLINIKTGKKLAVAALAM
jgi:acetaldehyde dehydrogenase/alcohol dehydrogenase